MKTTLIISTLAGVVYSVGYVFYNWNTLRGKNPPNPAPD